MEKGDARLIIAWERLVAARFIDPLAAPDLSDPCWRFAVWSFQPSRVLAERYGVTRDTINRIRRGSIWRQGDRVAQG